jgi:hypothetical protein
VEKGTYPNPAVVTASKNFVCVVGHAGAKVWETNHGSREIKQGTDKVKVCKLYSGITCADHVEIFKERAHPVFKNKTFETPHHLYFTPNGEEMKRNFGVFSPQDMVKEFNDILAKVPGTHISKDDYEGARTQVNQGAAHVKKDEIKKAIAVFTALTKHKNEMLRPMGQRELDALEASGGARVEAAIQTMGSNEEEGKKELKKVAEEYVPLACAKKAEEVLRLMAEKGR